MLSIVETTLGSSVADGGTTTVNYPSGTNKGTFNGGFANEVSVNGARYRVPNGVLMTFGSSNVTITNNTGAAWPAGAFMRVGLDIPGNTNVVSESGVNPLRCCTADTIMVNLGTPIASAAAGICASQSVAAGANALINGSLASGGAVAIDVPRNVVAAWTGTAVVTVRGFDEYGQPMIESSASGTSFTGKKAFKRVTRVSFSAAVTLATVGTGDTLGLPIMVPSISFVRQFILDDTNTAAQTFVGADFATKPSATSGDIRGTATYTNVPDGTRTYRLMITAPDPISIGPVPFTA